ncbi:MAG: hypothetical protein FJ271_25390 [Planctomycetes bacterium]|nr:hypothetical protein [Planctomycetota bacterium]
MKPWLRTGLLEGLGTFALVFFAAGAVCVNTMTTPDGQRIDHSPQTAMQPGLIGVALAQGIILALMLELTAMSPGGYFNPAITIVLWVFNRLSTRPLLGLIASQLAGALLAGGTMLLIFSTEVSASARLGTPHLNALANLESISRAGHRRRRRTHLDLFPCPGHLLVCWQRAQTGTDLRAAAWLCPGGSHAGRLRAGGVAADRRGHEPGALPWSRRLGSNLVAGAWSGRAVRGHVRLRGRPHPGRPGRRSCCLQDHGRKEVAAVLARQVQSGSRGLPWRH